MSSLQACQAAKQIMLHAWTAVQDLDLASIDQQALETQLSHIQQTSTELQTAASKICAAGFVSQPLRASHTQLLRLFSSLVPVIVSNLSSLHALASDGSSLQDSTVHPKFSSLWILLLSSSHVLDAFPTSLQIKDSGRSIHLQQAFTCLMHLLLSLTRSPAGQALIQHVPGHNTMFHYANVCLSLPLKYVACISSSSDSSVAKQVNSLPPEFLSLLSCLVLEQGSYQSEIPELQRHLTRTHRTSNGVHTLSLGGSLTTAFIKMFDLVDKKEHVLQLFTTPAIIQVLKRTLILLGYQPDIKQEQYINMLTTLGKLLYTSFSNNRKIEASITHTCLQASPGLDVALLSPYTPISQVSDTELLSAILQTLPEAETDQKQWYHCIEATVWAWNLPTPEAWVFPSSSHTDQDSGSIILMQHCALATVSRMRRSRYQKVCDSTQHPEQMILPDAGSPVMQGEISSQPCLPVDLQGILTQLYTSPVIMRHLTCLGDAIQNSEFLMFKYCQSGQILS